MEAATSDKKSRDNSKPGIDIPKEKGEAVNFVFNRLQNLYAQRKWCSSRRKDILEAARQKGIDPAAVRNGIRVARMTPERRAKYAEQMKQAFGPYGYVVTEAEETPDVTPLVGYVTECQVIDLERVGIIDAIRETKQAAKNAGLEMKPLGDLLSLSKLDPEERKDYFDNLDMLGTFLRFW